MSIPCGPLYPDEGLPPLGPTRLVTSPTIKQRFNLQQETDARTALARGLKEYVEQLNFDMLGRTVMFGKVFQTWASPEDIAEYPSASIATQGRGKYDASKFNVQLANPAERIWQTLGTYPVSPSEYSVDLMLTVWAEDNVQRAALVAMLEQALSPFEWMYGFRLELPFYFNQRATYEVMEGGYVDSEEDALARRKRMEFIIRSCVPVTRAVTLPGAKIRANTAVSNTPPVADQ